MEFQENKKTFKKDSLDQFEKNVIENVNMDFSQKMMLKWN